MVEYSILVQMRFARFGHLRCSVDVTPCAWRHASGAVPRSDVTCSCYARTGNQHEFSFYPEAGCIVS